MMAVSLEVLARVFAWVYVLVVVDASVHFFLLVRLRIVSLSAFAVSASVASAA